MQGSEEQQMELNTASNTTTPDELVQRPTNFDNSTYILLLGQNWTGDKIGPLFFPTQTTNKMEPSLNISNLFKEIEPQTPTTGHNMIVGDSRDYSC